MPEPPKVFISYSHDSRVHKQWVAELGAKLLQNGIDVKLDQSDSGPGDDLARFMEEGVKKSDRVLVICTDEYIRKADAGEGGVGYEKMIVTAEFVSNLGTNKFIPVVRNVNSETKTPYFLLTRKYIDLSDQADRKEHFEELLKELHKVPKKPPLGKNPFATISPGKEIPKVVQVPDDMHDGVDAYQKAVEMSRRGDLMGWRQLVKRVRFPVQRAFSDWRQRHNQNPLGDSAARQKALDEVVNELAPLLAVALAGVESGQEKFKDQRALVDDLLKVSGWDDSGLPVLTELPNTMVYVYQSLHGAICLSTGQMDLAIQLAEMRVGDVHDTGYARLWQRYDLVGWTGTLGESCRESWDYLSSAAERWAWLPLVFGTAQEFRISLTAYYMALNIYDLASRFSNHSQLNWSDSNEMDLKVPICFVSEPKEITDRALSLLTHDPSAVENLWTRFGIIRNDMERVWPDWLRACSAWIRNVYRLGVRSKMPHAQLFELI